MMRRMTTAGSYATRLASLLVLAVFGSAQPARAGIDWKTEDLDFSRVGVAAGLTPNVVTTVFRDRSGFLWVGSREGLFRYDGQSVERFVHDASDPTSISDNSIRWIFQDREGRLWVGTNTGGLNRLDPGNRSFTQFRADSNDPGSLSHDSVYAVAQDSAGHLWIGTQVGLGRLDPETGRIERIPVDLDHPEGSGSEYVAAVLVEENDTVWVGTVGDGLFVRRPGEERFSRVSPDSGFGDESVFSLMIDSRGRLWVGGDANAYVRTRPGGPFRMIPLAPLVQDPFVAVTALAESPEGRVFATSYGDGLFEIDPDSGETRLHGPRPGQPGGLGEGRVTGIVFDPGGGLMAATWGAGLMRASFHSRVFGNITEVIDARGLPVELRDVLGLASDPGTGVWAASVHVGLVLLDGTSDPVVGLPYPVGIGTEQIMATSVRPESPDRVWLGTMDSLIEYVPSSRTYREFEHRPDAPRSLGAGYVVAMAREADGALWIGTGGSGLWRMDGDGGFTGYRHVPSDPESLSGDYVTAIVPDAEGFLWIGTRSHGLNRCSTRPFRCRRHGAGPEGDLGHHHVTAIHQDRAGVFWIGTSGGGLHRARRLADGSIEGFDRIGGEDGLVDDHVTSLLEDDDSSLWIGTRTGLSRLAPDRDAFVNYVAADGLASSIFNAGAAARDKDRLFFGTVSGIVYLDAGTPFTPSPRSPLVFTSARDVTVDRELGGPLWADPEIVIDHGNVLELGFALLDYEGERHAYAYRLKPGSAWIGLDDSNQLIFADLPPGKHRLQIRGRGGRGLWTSAEIPIEIVPPFWMTAWFRALAAGLVVLSVVGVHQLRTRTLRARNRALQRLHDERERALDRLRVSERERRDAADGLRRLASRLESAKEEERQHISRELHDELGQTLTAAKIRLQLLQKTIGESAAHDQVQPAVDMVDSMIGQVRAISLNLRPPLLDEAGLVPALRHELKQVSARTGMPIRLTVSDDFPQLKPDVETVIFRVSQEAVSNSLRHAGASGISITLGVAGDEIRLVVEDDGKGFEVDEVRARALRGEHLGLLGLDERAISVGGVARLDSAPGRGTRVSVTIPLEH